MNISEKETKKGCFDNKSQETLGGDNSVESYLE